jgi:hypothetical protein
MGLCFTLHWHHTRSYSLHTALVTWESGFDWSLLNRRSPHKERLRIGLHSLSIQVSRVSGGSRYLIMVPSSSVKDSELSECSSGFNKEIRVSWLPVTSNVWLEVEGLIHVMIREASWPRKTHNYLRKVHWQAVQSVPDQICPKIRVWYKISLFLILWVKLFSMALHMSTRVYIQKISF